MSIASNILGASADALALVHDDDLVLMPANVPVTGYAEELERDPKTGQRLEIAEKAVTHIVHIRRSQLAAVILPKVVAISAVVKSYRVRYFTDDPNRPEVDFYCTLA